MKTNYSDIELAICKNLFAALMLLASGIRCVQMLTIAMSIIGYAFIITASAYIIYLFVVVSVLKSRG